MIIFYRKTKPVEIIDDVEAQLNEMFGEPEREDKENLRPNNQDCVQETRPDLAQERRKTTEPEVEVVQSTDESVEVEVEINGDVAMEAEEVEGISPIDSMPEGKCNFYLMIFSLNISSYLISHPYITKLSLDLLICKNLSAVV